MPVTIVKRKLSASTDGQSIAVSATAGATPITIHSTTSGSTIVDEIFLYCQNDYTKTIEICFEFGISQSGIVIAAQVPSRDGPQLVVPGFLLYGSAGCQTITAFVGSTFDSAAASAATSGSALVSVNGFVNRITQT